MSAAASLLHTISNCRSVKEHSTKSEEYLQAVKTPITSVWSLHNGKLMVKLQEKIAVAASLIFCNLSEKSSSF